MVNAKQYKYLSEEQVQHFMDFGYCILKGALAPEKAEQFTKDVWVRLDMDPNDQSTWTKERINMPHHRQENVETFCPTAWGAICELLGGADRISSEHHDWVDGLIVNLGKPEYLTETTPHPRDLDNWHCDGDFFAHFLDSPEQALLVIPLYSDIKPRGGGTMISPDGVNVVAKFLAEHPEGVKPGREAREAGQSFDFRAIINQCEVFHEMHGDKGDVVLMHPLMMHSASHNNLRIPRIITNPPVSVKEPFNFKRSNPDDYSLVELKTLKALGADPKEGYDFKITGKRERLIPDRLKVQEPMKILEAERLRKLAEKQAQAAQGAQVPMASSQPIAA